MKASRIFSFLFGGRYEVRGPAARAEELINAVMRHEIAHTDFTRDADGVLRFSVPRREAARLRDVIDKKGILGYSVIGKGLPFAVYRYRRRIGFVAGAALFCAVAWFSTLFVWKVEIAGDGGVSVEEVERNLAEIGVGIGTFIPDKDFWQLSTEYLARFDDCSWLSINVVGTTASVELRERVDAPDPPPDADAPCNVVAAEDGVIDSFVISEGRGYVVPNTVVRRGDLLVSGVIEDIQGELRLCHASAEVYAEVERTLEAYQPYAHAVREYTGAQDVRRSIIFFGAQIPLPFGGGDAGDCFETEESRDLLTLPDGKTLPFGTHTVCRRAYVEITAYYTPAQAREMAREALEAAIAREAGAARILEVERSVVEEGGGVRAFARIRCIRDIAQQKTIITTTGR